MKDDIDSDEYQMGAAGNATSRAQRDALNATSLVSARVAFGFLRPPRIISVTRPGFTNDLRQGRRLMPSVAANGAGGDFTVHVTSIRVLVRSLKWRSSVTQRGADVPVWSSISNAKCILMTPVNETNAPPVVGVACRLQTRPRALQR